MQSFWQRLHTSLQKEFDVPSDTEERYGLTWRVTPDLLGILNPGGRFEATNPAWFATLGYSAAEIEERAFFDFIHPDDIQRTEQAFIDIQQGKPILKFENRYRHKDGSYCWLSWNCVPEGGKFFCGARDITADKENQATLKTRDEEALLREQFIAVLGHDLRNPLAAIQSAIRLLARENPSERRELILTESQKSVDRMFGLLDALMDFARTRLGSGLSLQLSDSSELNNAIASTVREIKIAHPEMVIHAEIACQEGIACDIGRMCQLASNLLANAVTHGAPDEPVSLRAISNSENLEISVTNGGKAIPPEVIEHLFEPFVREKSRRSQEGLGLGLFICAEIAKAHDGRISVRSGESATTFLFTLPARRQ